MLRPFAMPICRSILPSGQDSGQEDIFSRHHALLCEILVKGGLTAAAVVRLQLHKQPPSYLA